MNWIDIHEMTKWAPLPGGYRFVLPTRADVALITTFIRIWLPDVGVGAASIYMRVEFLAKHVWLAGEMEKDGLVVLIKRGEELAGFFSCARDADMLALYVRFAIGAPALRGARLGRACVTLGESIAKAMGIGMVNAMATLKTPPPQWPFGASHRKPIGIAPVAGWIALKGPKHP